MSENQTGNTPAGAVLNVDPTVGDDMVAIHGGYMLLVADYVREGSDLVLVGPEGQTVVVDNYFINGKPTRSDDCRPCPCAWRSGPKTRQPRRTRSVCPIG
jgi:hypothetical protein